jgi:hypothetical protein
MALTLPVNEMTVEEKLRAMEMLWDDLRRKEENVPVPHWHKELLDERERLVREGKAHFENWETVKKRIADGVS